MAYGGYGGGLGQAGTRITRQLGEGSELWLHVKQAIVGAIAADVFLFVLILNVLWIGWWTVPLLACVFGAMVGISGLVFAYWMRLILPRWLEFILGGLWAIMAALGIGAGFFGRLRIDSALKALGRQVWSLFDLEPWWYVIGGILLVAFAAVVRKWKPMVAFGLIEVVAGLVLAVDLSACARIWSTLKWLLIPFTWPFGGMALVLVPVMIREMLWPNAEFTLQPVNLEDLGPGGLWSFYLPRMLKEAPEPAPQLPERIVKMEFTEGNTIKRPDFPDSIEARAFYRAVSRGEPFAWSSTAASCDVIRSEFEDLIRDQFIDLRWADWKDDQRHNLGVDLNAKGRAAIRGLASPSPTEEA